MQIVLRATCGGDYGWGHWIRTLNVASALIPRLTSAHILTLVHDGPMQSKKIADDRLGALLHSPQISVMSAEQFDTHLPTIDTFVIDRLEHSTEQLAFWRSRAHRLILWDDMGEVTGGADIVVRPQLLPHAAEVREAQVLSGPEYFPIDRAWLNVRANYDATHADTLLVCLGGGTTNRQGYLLVAQTLRTMSIDRVTFVLGYQLADSDLPTQIRQLAPTAEILGAADLPALATATKLAIIGGGFIKLDLAAAGVPMIILCGPDHQLTLGQAFAERGAAICAGRIDTLSPEKLSASVADLWADDQSRRKLSLAGRTLVDGAGADRIASILLQTA